MTQLHVTDFTMLKSKRATIYLGKNIQAAFEGFEGSEEEAGPNRSERLGTICASYLAMVGAALPDFDIGEWVTILNVYSGSLIGHDPHREARLLHANMVDDGTASPELIRKIQGLDLPARFAVLEVVHRHHALPNGEFDLGALIASVRGSIKKII